MSFLKQSLDNIKVWINEKIAEGLMDVDFSDETLAEEIVEEETKKDISDCIKSYMEKTKSMPADVIFPTVEQPVEKYNSWLIY